MAVLERQLLFLRVPHRENDSDPNLHDSACSAVGLVWRPTGSRHEA